MKVWLTEDVLRWGIIRPANVRVLDDDRVVEKSPPGFSWPIHHRKPNWHTTKAAAMRRAKKMRDDRLACLKKERRLLLSLRFKIEGKR